MADLPTISLTETNPTKIHSALRQVIEKSMGQQDASSNLATLSSPSSNAVFYSDTTSTIGVAIIGIDTTIFASNGSTAAPSFRTKASLGITLADFGGVASSRTISAAGVATGGGDLSADRTITVTAATQTNQEAGTSSVVAVTPAMQHFHQSAAKAWANIIWSGGTVPTLITGYNVSSTITDSGTGDFVIIYPVPFSSSTAYAVVANGHETTGVRVCMVHTMTASTTRIQVRNALGSLNDPVAVSIVAFGDL